MTPSAHTPFDPGRPFDEPWQAEAFALAVQLHRQGVFSWSEWSETLAGEIARLEAAGGEDYFLCWLNAVEALVARKGLASRDELADVATAWADAYRDTPHGEPVRLDGAVRPAGQ